jgi:hypothetical protein
MRALARLGLPWILAIALIAAAAPPLSAPLRALADADPASDILLGSPAFFPYRPAVSQQLQDRLIATLTQLRRKGLNLKVAIIESPIDLGAIPNMFGMPQTYADFLEREISFNQPQPLLVVMPAGFGVAQAGSRAALAGLKVATAGKSNGLTKSAILAVQRLASAAGKQLSGGKGAAPSGSSGGTSPLITFAAPAIVVLLAAFLAARLQRRRAD